MSRVHDASVRCLHNTIFLLYLLRAAVSRQKLVPTDMYAPSAIILQYICAQRRKGCATVCPRNLSKLNEWRVSAHVCLHRVEKWCAMGVLQEVPLNGPGRRLFSVSSRYAVCSIVDIRELHSVRVLHSLSKSWVPWAQGMLYAVVDIRELHSVRVLHSLSKSWVLWAQGMPYEVVDIRELHSVRVPHLLLSTFWVPWAQGMLYAV